jgi:hypothetical protein
MDCAGNTGPAGGAGSTTGAGSAAVSNCTSTVTRSTDTAGRSDWLSTHCMPAAATVCPCEERFATGAQQACSAATVDGALPATTFAGAFMGPVGQRVPSRQRHAAPELVIMTMRTMDRKPPVSLQLCAKGRMFVNVIRCRTQKGSCPYFIIASGRCDAYPRIGGLWGQPGNVSYLSMYTEVVKEEPLARKDDSCVEGGHAMKLHNTHDHAGAFLHEPKPGSVSNTPLGNTANTSAVWTREDRRRKEGARRRGVGVAGGYLLTLP